MIFSLTTAKNVGVSVAPHHLLFEGQHGCHTLRYGSNRPIGHAPQRSKPLLYANRATFLVFNYSYHIFYQNERKVQNDRPYTSATLLDSSFNLDFYPVRDSYSTAYNTDYDRCDNLVACLDIFDFLSMPISNTYSLGCGMLRHFSFLALSTNLNLSNDLLMRFLCGLAI